MNKSDALLQENKKSNLEKKSNRFLKSSKLSIILFSICVAFESLYLITVHFFPHLCLLAPTINDILGYILLFSGIIIIIPAFSLVFTDFGE